MKPDSLVPVRTGDVKGGEEREEKRERGES
jgi:hypothetical protein